jgi:O-antigen ligase
MSRSISFAFLNSSFISYVLLFRAKVGHILKKFHLWGRNNHFIKKAVERMQLNRKASLGFLERTGLTLLIVFPFFLPFFKPAVSIGLGVLVGIGILRLILDGAHRTYLIDSFQKGKKAIIVLMVFYFWMTMGSAWNYSDNAVDRLLKFDELLLVPFIAWALRDWIASGARHMLTSIAAGCLLASVVTLYFFAFPEQVPIGEGYHYFFMELSETRDFKKFGAYSPFLDRLYFAYLLGTYILVIWIASFTGEVKLFHYLSLLAIVPAFAVLGGRGAQLALWFGVVVSTLWYLFRTGFFRSKIMQSPVKWQFFLLCAFIVLPGILLFFGKDFKVTQRYDQLRWELSNFQSEERDLNELNYQTATLRLISWQYNLKLIGEYPWQGTGIGAYREKMDERYAADGITLPVHTNQQFLYFGVIGGFPLIGLFIVLFGLTFWQTFRERNESFKAFILAWWLYMLVVMLLDTPLRYQMPAFLFLVVWWGVYFTPLGKKKRLVLYRIIQFPPSAGRGDELLPYIPRFQIRSTV